MGFFSRNLKLDVRDGLISEWKFDESSGDTAIDTGPGGNHGTLVNSPTRVNGIKGKALSFNGNNTRVNTKNITNVILSDVSFSFWCKINDLDKDHGFIYKGTHSTGKPLLIWRDNTVGAGDLGVGNTNTLSVLTWDGTTQHWVAGTNDIFNDLLWKHIVVIVCPVNNYISIYINGQLNSTNTKTWNGIGNDSDIVSFGHPSGADTPAVALNGNLDDIRIYNRALTPQEIQILYNNGKSIIGA